MMRPVKGLVPRLGLRRSLCSNTATQPAESNANKLSAPLGGRSTAGSTATGEDADAAVMEPPPKRAKSLQASKHIYTYKEEHVSTYGARILIATYSRTEQPLKIGNIIHNDSSHYGSTLPPTAGNGFVSTNRTL
jgi:hypothetical protein